MLKYLWSAKDAKKDENADPDIALKESIEKLGQIKTEVDGTLTPDSILILRAIVLRQSIRKFAPKKEKYDEKRMEAFAQQH